MHKYLYVQNIVHGNAITFLQKYSSSIKNVHKMLSVKNLKIAQTVAWLTIALGLCIFALYTHLALY